MRAAITERDSLQPLAARLPHLCRLDLDDKVPDHSTFSVNRHGRFRESNLLRRVFETVLRRCTREGLVGGEFFAVDASLIKADANRQKLSERQPMEQLGYNVLYRWFVGLSPDDPIWDRPPSRRTESGCRVARYLPSS